MQALFDVINAVCGRIQIVSDLFWNFPTNFEWYASIPVIGNFSLAIILLVGSGIYFTCRLNFIQVRKFTYGIKVLRESKAVKTGISPLAAFFLSTAMRVGPANILGVTGAISVGGPGALLWMWISAFFGMATIFAEAVLAQIYRVTGENDRVVGGPAFYMSLGLGPKFKPMAVFFSAVAIITMGCMGSLVQSNTVSQALNHAFDIPLLASGIGVAILSGVVMFGGMGRLASVTEKLVPFMAGLYLIGGSYVLACHYDQIIPAFDLVFTAAFNPEAVGGGALGLTVAKAMQFGVARGLFSNEAGMGTTPHAHALADVKTPHEQGVVAMIGVFIDTFIVLTLNALVIISTLYTPGGPLESGTAPEGFIQANMAQIAFGSVMGTELGAAFVAVCLFFFAYSTIIGWNLFGKINMKYLFGEKSLKIYSAAALVFIFLGTVASNDLVWALSDMFNQLMVIPNAIALLALTGKVVESANKYSYKDKK